MPRLSKIFDTQAEICHTTRMGKEYFNKIEGMFYNCKLLIRRCVLPCILLHHFVSEEKARILKLLAVSLT